MQAKFSSISNNSSRANSAFMVGLFTILGALAFEHIGGYVPCELCLLQRWPYYIGLPLLAIIIGFWDKFPIILRIILTLIVALIFAWGAYLGAYHAGFEWGFWSGPASCGDNIEGLSFDQLRDINETRIIPCNEPQFRLFGISFAGYNAIISTLIAALLLWSAKGQYERLKNTN